MGAAGKSKLAPDCPSEFRPNGDIVRAQRTRGIDAANGNAEIDRARTERNERLTADFRSGHDLELVQKFKVVTWNNRRS